ncbi:hypothetical protein BH09SUM1_BH09SUM1_25120 [soil metagenome]
MSRWLGRCAVFLALAAALATADSFVRPIPDQSEIPPAAGTELEPGDVVIMAAPKLTVQALRERYDQGTANIIDARPIDQYREGHIPGAYHLDPAAFRAGRPELVDMLPTDLPIVIYCSGGDCDASHQVQKFLKSYGFTKLEVFDGGFPEWQSGDNPVETGEPAVQ